MASVPSWVWIAAGWCIIAPGVWMLIIGRVRKKRHGRRLCRAKRCGYDMAGIPTLRCPECGRIAAGEHELLTRRRSKRIRLIGALAIGAGWAAMHAPDISTGGWPGLVPDYALARWGPVAVSDPTRAAFYAATARPARPGYRQPTPRPAPSARPPIVPAADRTVLDRIQDDLYYDAQRRLLDGTLPDNLARHYLCRVHALDPYDTSAAVSTPGAWPRDQPFSFWHTEPNPNESPFPLSCFAVPRGKMGDAATTLFISITAYVSNRRIVLAEVDRRFDTTRPIKTFMLPAADSATDAAVAQALNPRLVIIGREVNLTFDQRTDSTQWRAVDCFVAFHISVLLDGEEVAVGECDALRRPMPGRDRPPPALAWQEDAQEKVAANPERVEIVLTGVPSGTVAEYVYGAWKHQPRAWAGTIRIRPLVERR